MKRSSGKANVNASWLLTLSFLIATSAVAQTAPTRQILVSLPDRKIAVIENGEVLKVFPVAIGKSDTPSPVGKFTIINRVVNPTYYHHGKEIGPGPENPVGNRWMGLSQKGYGIHGTNEPRSIGKAASHGCIRMARADLEQLFSLVRIGDEVQIVGERDTLTAQVFGPHSEPVILASASSTNTGGAQ